jgi:hypothetical protein
MRTHTIRRLAAVGVLALAAAACTGGASASEGPLQLQIAVPTDGATVSQPFMVTVRANVPLGDPSTGEHHVHLCFDGGDCNVEYTIVYGNTFVVKDLSPGSHTIEASLRNADHSDTGVSDRIDVTISGGTATTSGGAQGGGRGY